MKIKIAKDKEGHYIMIKESVQEEDITIANIFAQLWIIGKNKTKQESSGEKKSTFASLTTPKPLIVWITSNCGKFFKRWENQNT